MYVELHLSGLDMIKRNVGIIELAGKFTPYH